MPYSYDPATDAERLRRKRELAKRMSERVWAQYSPLIDAGAFKVANWGDAIGRLAQAWSARDAERDLREDEDTTARNQRDYETARAQEYFDASRGKVIDSGARDDMSPEPATTRTKPDMTQALAIAMNSKVPALMRLAEQERASREAYLKTPGASVASRTEAWQTGDPTRMQEEPKFQSVNGQLIRTDGGVPQPVLDARTKTEQIPPPPGSPEGLIWERDETGKTTAVGKQQPNQVNVNTAGPFGKTLFEGQVKKLNEKQPEVEKAARSYTLMRDALKYIPAAFTGAGANVLLEAKKWLKLVGLTDDAVGQINNSEQLRSVLGELVFKNIKNLGNGTGLSDSDREFANKVSLADLRNDPKALEYAIQLAQADALNTFISYQTMLGKTIEAFPEEANRLTMLNMPDPATNMEPVGIKRTANGYWVVRDYGEQPYKFSSTQETPVTPPDQPASKAYSDPETERAFQEYKKERERKRLSRPENW